MKDFITGCFIMWTYWVLVVYFNFVPMDSAIKHHTAHYDSQAGAFTWNDQKVEGEAK